MVTELTADPKAAIKAVESAVVVFYAPWCGDSRASEDYEAKMEAEFAGKISFYRLDASELEDIADTYNVERYPTYVFFRKGKAQRGTLAEPVAEGEVRNWLELQLRRR